MENFDISALSYEQFLEYFFTTPEGAAPRLNANGEEYWMVVKTNAGVVVGHLTRFFQEFGQFARHVSLETLDNGIDEMFSPGAFELQTVLWDKGVPLQERIDCIRSMYRVFADFVENREVGTSEGCFFMWWDFICWGFWFDQIYHKKLPRQDYELLGEEERRLVDAMFETLVEILKLDGNSARGAALHGLGHVHHPGVRAVVQEFIDQHSADLDAKEVSWLEKCRDGTNM